MELFSVPFDEWIAERKNAVLANLTYTPGADRGQLAEAARRAADPFRLSAADLPGIPDDPAAVTLTPFAPELPAGVPGQAEDKAVRVRVRVAIAGRAELFRIHPGTNGTTAPWPRGEIGGGAVELVIRAGDAGHVAKLLADLRRGADRVAHFLRLFHHPQAWAASLIEEREAARAEREREVARAAEKLRLFGHPVVTG